MVKLSAFNPKPGTLQLLDEGDIVESHREYLGMSMIGHSCSRFLWYSFRWAYVSTHSRRMERLFKRGHMQESIIVADLKRIGYTVSGEQDEVSCSWGHCRGHRDGVVEGVAEAPKTPHLLEMKTMSDKNFKSLKKSGVKISKPGYYAQCQIYMKFFKLKRTLFITVNKNDDSYYVERLRYDKDYCDDLVRRADSIVMSNVPLPKLFEPTWWECKFCDARDICHYDKPLERNCRTCTKILPEEKGYWRCDEHNKLLTVIEQKRGCEYYESI